MSNVKDVKRKAIKIVLSDGVERELKFTLNAMAELEDIYGEAQKAFDLLEKNSFKALRCILWAGFLHIDEENLTEKQVGNLIDMAYISELIERLNSVFESDMPSEDEENGESLNHPN